MGDNNLVALRDINGDGLPDRILLQFCYPYTNWWVQVNTGNGFAPIQNFGPYFGQDPNNPALSGIQSAGAMLLDMNGDGLPDRVEAVEYPTSSSNYFVVQLSSGPFPDLLTVVSNGMGGAITTTYKPSTLYDNRESTNTNARQLLPFPMYTVASLAVGDGVYQANTNIYLYEGGMWNFARREFNGFAKTTEVDPLGATNLHWFHQAGGRDNSVFGEFQDSTTAIGKRGMKFRVDTFGTNGQPYKLTLNKVVVHGREWRTYEEAARELHIGNAGLTKGGIEAIQSVARTAAAAADAYTTILPDLATAGMATAPIVIGKAGRAAEEEAVTKGAKILENGPRGRASEAKVLKEMGLGKNTAKVSTAEGNSIPDALTGQSSIEIKDALVVNKTKQLRIQTDAAKAAGKQSVLVTGTKTQVSAPAQKSFDKVIQRPDLGPQQ